MSPKSYVVVEKTSRGTRYYAGGDVFTHLETNAARLTETGARNKAAELNDRYALEAHWCRYDARPASKPGESS